MNLLEIRDRFWSKVKILNGVLGQNLCWEWSASLGSHGYGNIRIDGKTCLSHRVSYELTKGVIPYGMCIMHVCDNRKCCNPRHLILGTEQDNASDMAAKGRSKNGGLKGEQIGDSKLTEADILAIRADSRVNREITKQYGIGVTQVGNIKRREQWKHV